MWGCQRRILTAQGWAGSSADGIPGNGLCAERDLRPIVNVPAAEVSAHIDDDDVISPEVHSAPAN